MASEKFMELLENLHQATIEGRVHWNETSTEKEFLVNLGSLIVEIEEEETEEDSSYDFRYVVTLSTPEGKTLDLEIFRNYGSDKSQYETVSTLYEQARKDALKIDQILDSAISNLKKKN